MISVRVFTVHSLGRAVWKKESPCLGGVFLFESTIRDRAYSYRGGRSDLDTVLLHTLGGLRAKCPWSFVAFKPAVGKWATTLDILLFSGLMWLRDATGGPGRRLGPGSLVCRLISSLLYLASF